jgi:hypothetical protein
MLEKPDTDLDQERSNGGEHFAHYAEAAEITEGYVMGTPVVALCGKVFIPHRDPERFKICPSCKKIMDALFLST